MSKWRQNYMNTYTDIEIEEYLKYLKDLIYKVNYKNQLNSKKNVRLREFINDSVPELSDPFFTLQTKIYWLLNDIHEFPKCQNENCHHVFNDVNVVPKYGYQKYCSYKCSNSCEQKKRLTSAHLIKKYGSIEKAYIEISNKASITYNKKTHEEKEQIKERRKQTNLKKFGTECNLLSPNNIRKSRQTNLEKFGTIFPTQAKEIQEKIQNTKLERYNDKHYTNKEKAKKTCLKKYGVEYSIAAKGVREKGEQTNLKRYGVKNGGASDIAHRKMARKYLYDGTTFTSSSELAFYIWLKDHGIKFEYQPKFIEYFDEINEKHRYYPDFKVNGALIELKGDHLIDEHGNLCFPYKKGLSLKEIEKAKMVFKAKQKCMEDNSVIVIKHSDCKKYYDYIKSKYGKNFLEQFRKKSNKV